MQASFSELGYASKKKQIRRDRFLDEIEVTAPWDVLIAVIAPHYPVNDEHARLTTPLGSSCACTLRSNALGPPTKG